MRTSPRHIVEVHPTVFGRRNTESRPDIDQSLLCISSWVHTGLPSLNKISFIGTTETFTLNYMWRRPSCRFSLGSLYEVMISKKEITLVIDKFSKSSGRMIRINKLDNMWRMYGTTCEDNNDTRDVRMGNEYNGDI